MAKDHYSDITEKLDMIEMKNTIVMAMKELPTYFVLSQLNTKYAIVIKST